MSSTAFIEPKTVMEFIRELLNNKDISRGLSDTDRNKVCFLFSSMTVPQRQEVALAVPNHIVHSYLNDMEQYFYISNCHLESYAY